ncbi:MAG: hybrid sensor histidine kinase/response regulator [Gammaproteobacteria bacterium]|nr:MAG: hybrid sensor histidine kinase/response regulator [Gammaproteobacteria bacterium]
MSNFFDIDYEQEYLVDFLDDMNERISEIEQISIKLDNSNGADPAIVSLIGAINTIKNNANETQIIPLASSLDSLENILSIFAQKELVLPVNFSRFIGCVFEIANEMAEQAAEMQKVDFDLFSKIQNSLQPLSQCDANTVQETISMAISFLSSTDDSGETDSSIDLFGSEDSDEIELFDEPETTTKEPSKDSPTFITYYGNEFFTPSHSQRSIEDLQAFRLLADEAASASNRKISLILTLARFLNAAAKNPVDASQLEAAVYLNEIRPTCPNKCAKTIAHMSIIPSSPGWELASSIVVFKNLKSPIENTSDKSLGSQIFNGAQILGLCLEFAKLTNFSTDKEEIASAKRKIAHMSDRFSINWLKIFLRLVDKVIEYSNKNGQKSNKTASISPKTILCLDDDEITLMVFDHMLKKAGHVPITVDNYDDALKIIQNNPPDLILLDLNMPGKGGYWLIEEKNSNDVLRDIPVAIISGSKEDYGIDTKQVIGIYEKPVSKDTMLEIINKACG